MKMKRRILALLVVASMILTTMPCRPVFADAEQSPIEEVQQPTEEVQQPTQEPQPTEESQPTTDHLENGYNVTFKVTSQWENAFNADVTIENTTNEVIHNWALSFSMPYTITNIWSANVLSNDDGIYTIKNIENNQDIEANSSITFGFCASANGSLQVPNCFIMPSKQVDVDASTYQAKYVTSNSYDTSFTGKISITNNSDRTIEDWTMEFDFPYQITRFWTAQIVSKTNNHYVIKNAGNNANIKPGETLTLDFDGEPDNVSSDPTNIVLHQRVVDSSLLNLDRDQDSLTDAQELKLGTNVYDYDTDHDALPDGYEVNVTKTDPLKADTDGNGILDGDEDFDQDLLTNKEECLYGTDPFIEDTDGDSYTDYYEVNNGMDPLVFDEYSPYDENTDDDYDKLNNKEERKLGTNIYDADTDSDGFSDYYEVKHGMNPLVADELNINSTQAAEIHDNDLRDLQALNADAYYPLDISYNDEDTQITSIMGKYSDISVECANDALYSLYSIKTLIGLTDPANQLKFEQASFGESGPTYTFQQYYNGIKVNGSSVTVSVDTEGNVVSLGSYVLSDQVLGTNLSTMTPKLSIDDIEDILSNKYSNEQEVSHSLMIYAKNYNEKQLLVYHLVLSNGKKNRSVLIDANTGEIVLDRIQGNCQVVQGSGKDEDYKTGDPLTTFPVWTAPAIDNPSETEYSMVDTKKNIYMYELEGKLISNKDNIWSDPVAVSTYNNVRTAYDWWAKKLKYKCINGKGGEIDVYIHETWDPDNAMYYWDLLKEYFSFCEGSAGKKSAGAFLDTVGHEYTHAVVHHNTLIMLGTEANTINEAYADIFGSFINNNTWMQDPRSLSNPGVHSDPDSTNSQYYNGDFLDEHDNATVIGHAAYLMEHDYHIPFTKLYTLWYDSIKEGYSDFSTFYTVRENVIKAAIKNKFTPQEITDIGKAFDAVGIMNGAGDLVLSIYDGNTPITGARVIVSRYSNVKTAFTNADGKAFISTETGTNTIRIEIKGYEPIFTQVLIKNKKTVNKNINLVTSKTKFTWKKYDHPNYAQPYVTPIPTHIVSTGNDIKMIGYTVDPLKDFLITSDIDGTDLDVMYRTKILSFKIKRDNNNWHTMEGGGFIFGACVEKNNAGKEFLSGYCLLVMSDGLNLYELQDVDIEAFRNGKLGNISTIGKHLGHYDIGNVLDNHNLTLKINYDRISVWDGTNKLIIDGYKYKALYGGDFGPITSHISHYCDQVSYFTFSDIQMTSIYDY